MSEEKRDIQKMLNKPYKYGFKTIIESDVFPKGLSEDVVRAISAKKEEPEWLLEFRCAGSSDLCHCSTQRQCCGLRTRRPLALTAPPRLVLCLAG
jgi:hypothetical protein